MPGWSLDGARAKSDAVRIAAVSDNVSTPAIASGGAKRADHLVATLNAGANAVPAASTFHDGDCTVADFNQAMTPNRLESELW